MPFKDANFAKVIGSGDKNQQIMIEKLKHFGPSKFSCTVHQHYIYSHFLKQIKKFQTAINTS